MQTLTVVAKEDGSATLTTAGEESGSVATIKGPSNTERPTVVATASSDGTVAMFQPHAQTPLFVHAPQATPGPSGGGGGGADVEICKVVGPQGQEIPQGSEVVWSGIPEIKEEPEEREEEEYEEEEDVIIIDPETTMKYLTGIILIYCPIFF